MREPVTTISSSIWGCSLAGVVVAGNTLARMDATTTMARLAIECRSKRTVGSSSQSTWYGPDDLAGGTSG